MKLSSPLSLFLSTLALTTIHITAQVTPNQPVALLPSGPPAPGGGADLSLYPQCAQTTGLLTGDICIDDPNSLTCTCGPRNRAVAAAVESLICTDVDFETNLAYAADLCSDLYTPNATLVSAVSAAIASETAKAQAIAKSGDVADIKNRPVCAQNCIPLGLSAGGCTSLRDRECVCRCPIVDDTIGECEIKTCTREELDDIRYSVIELCRPVGGLFPKLQSTCKPGDGGNGTLGTGVVTSGLPPKPTATGESVTPPFRGEATRVGLTFSVEKVLVLLLVGIVGLDMLVV